MRRRHNGRLMKRLMILILLAVLLVPSAAAAPEQAEADRKLINVVYDDSGSMVKSKGILIERWSQAKYALEVFCAMMGEKDVMNIFPMSKEGGLGLTLYGSDPNRVAAVHEMNGNYRNTPFKTVTAAGKNLLNAEAGYEKWLLIITDGAFDDGATPTATVQMQLEKYHEAGIKTVYLGIGDSAPVLQSNPEAGAYAEKAADGTQVLEKVTSIANQIFTHQILRDKYIAVSDSVTALSIDIPTDQIIVFAQGNDVSVGGLKLNGKEIPAAAVEHVKYSDVVPPNYPAAVCDTTLKGVVATFESGDTPFAKGRFEVEISGADTVQYYYRPGVKVNCSLLYNGAEVGANDELYAGEYEITMEFVDPLAKQPITSELLSDAVFALAADNNDRTQTLEQTRGSVTLEQGEVKIRAMAELPGHVKLTSTRNYTVLPEPIQLNLRFEPEIPVYTADRFGENAKPVLMHISNAETGMALTAVESAAVKVTMQSKNGIAWKVTPSADPAVWELRPLSEDGTIGSVPAGETVFDVLAEYKMGNQSAFGAASLTFLTEEYESTGLKIEIGEPPAPYDVHTLDSAQGMTVSVLKENPQTGEYEPLDANLWNSMELEASSDKRVSWTVERGAAVGTWVLTPGFYKGDKPSTEGGDVTVMVTAEGSDGELVYRGEGSRTVSVEPLNTMEILIPWLIRLLILLVILWVLLCYIRKKRVPVRKLNPRCSYDGDVSPQLAIKKDIGAIIWPPAAERATVYCHRPSMECAFPDLRIKAAGRNSFYILNRDIDLEHTKIDGEFMDADTLKKRRFAYGSFAMVTYSAGREERLGTFTFQK